MGSSLDIFNFYLNLLLPPIEYSLNQVSYNSYNNLIFSYNFVILSNSYIISSFFDNFYKTDIISQSSLNMSKCTKELLDKTPFKLY